jgi:peptide/nickel transport system permease protein
MTPLLRRVAILLAVIVHAILFAAPWIAPYDPSVQHRDAPLRPPTAVHLVDAEGRWHGRPFVCAQAPAAGSVASVREDCSVTFPINAWVRRSAPVGFLTRTATHLFGVDEPGHLFLLGTDEFGRDVFSRLLVGARISIVMAVSAAALAIALALVGGSVAGYAGGLADFVLSAITEIVLALPWLYLILAVRAALPLVLTPGQAMVLIVLLLGSIGWARPGRLVRAAVASTRTHDYVAAARTAGASTPYVLRRHVWPELSGLLATAALILVRQFVMAETTLSLFGLGIPEPTPSWGTMLAAALRPQVLTETWWLLAPVAGLVGVCVMYYVLDRALRPAPRHDRI